MILALLALWLIAAWRGLLSRTSHAALAALMALLIIVPTSPSSEALPAHGNAPPVAITYTTPATVPEQLARWAYIVEPAAAECGVPVAAIYAAMDIETDGDETLISSAGATGLMQVMPREAGAMFADRPTRAELLDPATNVRWAACHLRQLSDAHGWRSAFERYYGLGGAMTAWYGDEAMRLMALYTVAESGGGCCGVWPVAGSITQRFGDPVSYPPFAHTGTDIGAPCGTPIYTTAAGVVLAADPPELAATGPRDGYGPFAVRIQHSDGTISTYAHNQARYVAAGDTVAAGQHVAAVGDVGYSSGCHLHFELWRNNQFIDPQLAIVAR